MLTDVMTYRGRDEAGGRSFELLRAGAARDLLLAAGFSRATCARILADGQVRRGGEALGQASLLEAGDEVVIVPCAGEAAETADPSGLPAGGATDPSGLPADGAANGPGPTAPDLRVLWEDDFALAVDKPQGILVHDDGTGAPTLSDQVEAYLAASSQAFCAQAVQRLDFETSGVVLFSKLAEFQPFFDALVGQKAGTTGMRKRYLAVVRGTFPQARMDISEPISRDRHDARRMRVSPGGKPSRTEVELLQVMEEPDGARYSLLAATLVTGRRHQIRVHLAACGHPIVNDGLYGCPDRGPYEGRGLMLHALCEEFVEPLTGEAVRAETPWPVRFPQRRA